ncbi:hypothetical protein ISCGN_011297 [Ixodes scapularis]
MSKLRQRRLCSEHFDATAFASYRKSRLRKNACPTVLVTDPLVQGLVPPEFFGHGSESAAGCSSFVPSQPPQDAPQQQQMQGPHIAVPSPPQDAPQEQERQVPYIVPSTTPLGADLEEGVIGPHLVAPDDPQDEEAQGPHIGTPQRTSMGSTAAAVAGPSTSSTADRRATPKRQVGRPKKPYTPRTRSTLAHLRKTRDQLRRSLFKASQKTDFADLTRHQVLKGASKFISKGALDLFKIQLHLQPMNKFGRRWPDEFKPFALNLYFQSRRAYKYLAKYLSLPSVRSLKNWLSRIAMHPGVVPSLITTVVNKLHDWPLKDRACILMFDEISLKENLFYDSKSDIVHGFADNGIH